MTAATHPTGTPVIGPLPRKFFADKAAQQAVFAKLVDAGLLPGASVVAVSAEAGVALTARMNLRRFSVTTRENGTRLTTTVRGKRMTPEIFQLMQLLASQRPALLAPTHIFYDPRRQYTLYRELEGKTLRQLERSRTVWRAQAPAIGTYLARLHRLAPRFLPVRSAAQERDFLLNRARLLAADAAVPVSWETRARRLAKDLGRLTRGHPTTLVHGDFQASNILVNQARRQVGAIDFSSASRYHPAADLGWFLVHSNLMLRYHFRQATIDPWLTAVFRAYSRASQPAQVKRTLAVLPWFLERTLVDIATVSISSFRTPGPERDKIFFLLDEIATNARFGGSARIQLPPV
jgi:tRNA A-37 threonylcarbamoyl transferase component Bud32